MGYTFDMSLRISILVSLISLWFGCAAPATFSEMVPNTFQAGERQSVEIRGSGFSDDTLFTFVSGDIEVSLGALVIESDTLASGEIPPAAPSGMYALIISRGESEVRVEDALNIVEGKAQIVFVDVGQGDATLVIAPSGETLLIDGGPGDQLEIVQALDTYANGRLDAVIVSHHDADHLGGIVRVLAGRDNEVNTVDDLMVETRWGPTDDDSCQSQTCRRFRLLRAGRFSQPNIGDVLTLGEVEIEVVARDGDVGNGALADADTPNEKSLVVLIRFADQKVLVLGDLTGGGSGDANLEEPLANRIGSVDILRTGHHGSRTSSNANALSLFSPRASILSVGTDNSFCHPADDVLERLSLLTPRVFGTGAGIVNRDSCATTREYENVAMGLGDIRLDILRDGSVFINDEGL